MTTALDDLITELTAIKAMPAVEQGLAIRRMLGASRPQTDLRQALREAMEVLRASGMSHQSIATTQGVARQQITAILRD